MLTAGLGSSLLCCPPRSDWLREAVAEWHQNERQTLGWRHVHSDHREALDNSLRHLKNWGSFHI